MRLASLALFCLVFVVPAALGCLWILLVRWDALPDSDGGWLWLITIWTAPWVLLAAGAWLLLSGAARHVWHRSSRQTRREEEALGVRLPAPRPIRLSLTAGAAAVLLAALVLVPSFGGGVLVWESETVERLPVGGTSRWEGDQFVSDYADQRVLTCTYLTLGGIRESVFAASRQFPYCPYIFRRRR